MVWAHFLNRNVVASADVFQYYSYFVATLTIPNHQDDEITMTIEAICKRETEHEDTTIIRGIIERNVPIHKGCYFYWWMQLGFSRWQKE